jgi:nickel-dependent lactate racemase
LKKIIQIPYGKKNYIKLKVPNNNLIGIFKPKKSEPIIAEKHAIQKALSKPIGVSPLKELAKGKKNATIAITDASRPNIERKILPIIIEHLESGGPTKDNIKIIVGSGAH